MTIRHTIEVFMKEMIKKLILYPIRQYQIAKALPGVTALANHENEVVRQCGVAILDTFRNNLSQSDRDIVLSIERRRKELLSSQDRISVVDFGAGSPESKRNKEEMRKGVKSEIEVSKLCKASKPPFWALLLYKLIQNTKPNTCLELGTCLGISASYQGKALELFSDGKLSTLEGSEEIAKIATDTIKMQNLENVDVIIGPFHKTLETTLEKLGKIDYFFNDGHHDFNAVVENFNIALPYLSNTAIVILDDINWSVGMIKAWDKLTEHESVVCSIDLGMVGLLIVDKEKPDNKSEKIIIKLTV